MRKLFLFFLLAGSAEVMAQTIVVPVVFHVVYNTAAENVSDAVILQQLQTLNADYSDTTCLNTYIADVNTGIQFTMAQQDPNGNPTNGITRTSTTTSSFSTNDAVKYAAQGGHDIWDRDNYLNIYICDLSGGLLGYAPFPCGPASTDGLVIDYQYMTGGSIPYDLGRTATHELGHWFGLKHLMSDSCTVDADSIADTPVQTNASSCGDQTLSSCSGLADSLLAKNFMSYAADACKCFFTPGQKAKMWNVINTCRTSLKTSIGGNPPAAIAEMLEEKNISIFPNPSAGFFEVSIKAPSSVYDVSFFNPFGMEVKQVSMKSSPVLINGSDLPAGIYTVSFTSDRTVVVKRLVIVK